MRSGKRIKVSVPLQRFEPLEILKIKEKKFLKYIFECIYTNVCTNTNVYLTTVEQ